MKDFKEGDQVVFKVLNEFLIGKIVFKYPGTEMYEIDEGGIAWVIESDQIFYPEDIFI